MHTFTLAELLLGVGAFTRELLIPRSQFAGTADTDGNTTQLLDTELAVFANDYFNDDYFIYITAGGVSGAGTGNIRQIDDFVSSGGSVVPDVVFAGVPKTGAVYQIWKCHVQDMVDALNDALISIYPKLYKKIIFEGLGKETLVADAAAAQAVVEVTDDTLFWVGQNVTIKDDSSSENRIISSIAAATNKITMTAVLTNAYTTAANAVVYGVSGKYWNLGAEIGDARVTSVSIEDCNTSHTNIRTRQVQYHIIQSDAGDRQIYFPKSVSVDDDSWVIEAMDKLEAVAADTPAGTVTLEDRRVRLLYAEAAYHFYSRQARDVSSGDWDRLNALADKYRKMVYVDFRHLWMPRITEFADMTTDGDYQGQRVSQTHVTWTP